MNDSQLIAIVSACWLGILTSISPCPMATNIAAISYIGKKVDRPLYVLFSGLLYTAGRTLTYVILAMFIIFSLMAIPDLSFFLQNHMNKFLGPILMLAGLVLLGWLKFNIGGPGLTAKWQRGLEKLGFGGAILLGFLFALSFCPVSAAIFFGSLIPVAVEHNSIVIMPTAYGVGTAIPVVAAAILISLGSRYIGAFFNKLFSFERWARRITGAIFILLGLYLTCVYILGFSL